MRSSTKVLAAVGLGVVGTLALAAWAAQAPAQHAIHALEQTKVDLAAAVEAALKEIPGAKLVEADLERAGRRVVWELDQLTADALIKTQVDASTGKVVRVWDATAEEPGDAAAAKKAVEAAKITWREALEAAQLVNAGGRLFHIELEMEHGQPVFDVELLAREKRIEVQIDGVSGKLLKSEGSGTDAGDDEEGEEQEEDEEEGLPAHAAARSAETLFTDTFMLESRELATAGRNPYFVLEPGYQLVFNGREGGHAVRLTITVLNETKKVGNVETRVVEERETKDGELAEVSRNYFAICKRTNDVFYFGETTDAYRDGKVVGHEGAWEAGVNRARAGLMMPGTPLLGARFYQEIAPEVAMDRAEIVSLAETLNAPSGNYKGCLKVEETTPLEPGVREYKLYAPGVGLIQDGGLALVEITK